ncbi:hypothetical protein VP01_5256g1 [Puccinia sorghi]|uniref:DUF659 domain-containing protein n=1 Tax=Puccinia sorghi TaxID=27349 RepID=A0A0L6UKH0_9BASI|nr:hypothetical protein VP01_5256g1 [Puccinia sorghi]
MTRTTKDEDGFFGQSEMGLLYTGCLDCIIYGQHDHCGPPHSGSHTGKNFANMFCHFLKKYNLQNKLHTIMANNATTNSQMGCEVQDLIPLFTAVANYLGCIAHVIKLGAKYCLDVQGSLDDPNHGEIMNRKIEDSPGSSIIGSMDSEPMINFAQPHLCELSSNFTILDINRAIKLHQSCAHFCNKNSEVSKFKLMDSKLTLFQYDTAAPSTE